MSLIFLARQNKIQMHVGTQYNFVIFMSIAASITQQLPSPEASHSQHNPTT
jgi:hypothetical protein